MVVAVGPQTRDMKRGDKVVVAISGYCNRCVYCKRGKPQACDRKALKRMDDQPARAVRYRDGKKLLPGFGLGGFSEYMLVSENNVALLDLSENLQHAAFVGCAALTSYGAIAHANGSKHDEIAIVGAGGLGLFAVKVAALVGVGRISVMDVNPIKLQYALEYGATDTMLMSDACLKQNHARYSHVFEMVGGSHMQDTLPVCMQLLDRGGRLHVVGVPASNILLPQTSLLSFLIDNQSIVSINIGNINFRKGIADVLQLKRSKRLVFDDMLENIPFDQVNDMYRQEDRKRCVIDFSLPCSVLNKKAA